MHVPATAILQGKQQASAGRVGCWLVIASFMMNIVLCFIKTRHWAPVYNPEIAGTELLILAAGALAVRRILTHTTVMLCGISIGMLVALKLLNHDLTLKIIHDLAIIVIFTLLGRQASLRQVERLQGLLMLIILAVGMFELLFTDLFGQLLDVWTYYVDKGVLTASTVNYSGTNLYLSGDRGALQRNFFPGLLGTHRVSSVFLEPDSMGNYAAIVFAWCVCAPVERRKPRIALLAASLLCIILADGRFAAGCCGAIAIARMIPVIGRSRVTALLIPLITVLLLTMVGSIAQRPGILPSILKDDLSGRLLFSARLMDYWDTEQWFALAKSQVYVADTGYAYLINSVGLPLALLLLVVFASRPLATRQAEHLRVATSVYIGTALCIGAAIFTIKTASLLWFQYGALCALAARPAAGSRFTLRRMVVAPRPIPLPETA